jgi:MFS family permease
VTLTPYRQVLAVPGLRRLLLIATIARIPTTANGVILTLHVVTVMHRGYGAAGIVAAAITVGAALGGPWRGRAVDRFGVRAALWPSIIVESAFWVVSPWLPYSVLLPGAVLAGLCVLPVFSVTRQAIGVMVPDTLRRTAMAADSITVEASFMIGPLAGVLAVTGLSSAVALVGVGLLQSLAGLALVYANPPTRSDDTSNERQARRDWFTPKFAAVLLLMTASVMALSGTDVATVALMRSQGQTQLLGLVFFGWGLGSMIGGAVYGALPRAASSATLVLGLALLTIPLGLAHSWWVLGLALLVVGGLCAPSVASTAGDVNRLVPESRRGEAMGWHTTSATFGSALGAPLAGVAIDHFGPGSGFAVTGAAGFVLALAAVVITRGGRTRSVTSAPRIALTKLVK